MRALGAIAAIGIAALLVGGVSCSWAAGQEESDIFWGEIPKNTPTYSIRMGTQEIMGAIEGEQFLDEKAFEALGSLEQVTVVRDTPWEPYRKPMGKAQAELGTQEPVRARLERLRRGWKDSPYEIVEAVGEWRLLPRGERELAEEAQKKADKVYDQLYPPVMEEVSVAPPPEPGFLAYYGWHIAVLAAAVLSLALVLKGMVFR